MKNKLFKVGMSLLLLGSMASCDYLDLKPLDSYSDADVFTDPVMAEAYVNQRYVELRNGYGSAAMRFASDESMNNFNWNSVYIINKGQLTPDQMGGFDVWSLYYTAIKNCNLFLAKKSAFSDKNLDNRLVGEVKFLRAYFYTELVNRYGGIPIITNVFDLSGEMKVKRNTYEECVKFIADECDQAAALLPVRQTGANFGRATKGAALALKSKILLYAASPLWNSQNDKSKWQAAADAAKAVIDLKDNGAPVYSLDPSYKGWYLNRNSSEVIFQRVYNKEFGHSHDWSNSPNGFNGYSATCVTQEMVDSYEMADGTMPSPSLYANADGVNSTPWDGREPRFYASIVCDGQKFRGREIEFYTYGAGSNSGGLDSEYGIDNWNYSKSHYTIRKFMDESLSKPWSDKSDKSWVFSRLGEIYLNYAEAMFNLGNEGVAKEYINKIRERARGGKANILPDVTASGDALLKAIQHERKIELAFEEHRYFDVRRWKIADATENITVHRIDIVKDRATGLKTYTINKMQDRSFKSQHYLFPIPRTEMQRVPVLVQNPGYN